MAIMQRPNAHARSASESTYANDDLSAQTDLSRRTIAHGTRVGRDGPPRLQYNCFSCARHFQVPMDATLAA
ncbi:hypothetical protein RvY_14406 [Ramazzottius varieornatus]|uniref:Uncharacterized protein n=1 Tax=Ramazzottius varieornatus TaxID=947166 RepID=A0A1D1VW93_RAMVA|nr:hypothetical protein RvY_14406 [Ramazzottius varieornatus]